MQPARRLCVFTKNRVTATDQSTGRHQTDSARCRQLLPGHDRLNGEPITMHIHIDTADNTERKRIRRLLQFLLSGQRSEIDSLQLIIEPVRDALGTRLNRCQIRSTLKLGQQIEVAERQSSLDLAVTRALERCMRTIQRKLRVTS